jgi:hypothetical protein
MEKVRVLRILEYVGTQDFIQNCIDHTGVPWEGTRVDLKGNVIKAAVLDKYFGEKVKESSDGE